MAKKTPSPAKLRELVMQALYQKEISGSSNTDLIKQFKQTNRDFNLEKFEDSLKEIKKGILEIKNPTNLEKVTRIFYFLALNESPNFLIKVPKKIGL